MPILQITYGFNGSDNRYGNWINVFPGEETMWKINVFAENDYPDGERHEMKFTADSDDEMLAIVRKYGFTGQFRYVAEGWDSTTGTTTSPVETD